MFKFKGSNRLTLHKNGRQSSDEITGKLKFKSDKDGAQDLCQNQFHKNDSQQQRQNLPLRMHSVHLPSINLLNRKFSLSGIGQTKCRTQSLKNIRQLNPNQANSLKNVHSFKRREELKKTIDSKTKLSPKRLGSQRSKQIMKIESKKSDLGSSSNKSCGQKIFKNSLKSPFSFAEKNTKRLIISKTKTHSEAGFLYSQLSNFDIEQELWLEHLRRQLDIHQIAEEFQKIELNRNIQGSKNLTLRQAYKLKKEVGSQIEADNSSAVEEVCQKINKLAEIALDEREMDKLMMFSFFLKIREMLRLISSTKDKFIYDQKASRAMREEVQGWKDYKLSETTSSINIKILTVLSFHVLKIGPPVLSADQLQLIALNIQMKKFEYCSSDIFYKSQKREQLEKLLFLAFRFLKKVHYMELAQEFKTDLYHMIKAYLELYQKKFGCQAYEKFEKRYKIAKATNLMRPPSIGIFPYMDSKERSEIKFSNLLKEMSSQQLEKEVPNIKINAKNLGKFIQDQKDQKVMNMDNDIDHSVEENSKDTDNQGSFKSSQTSANLINDQKNEKAFSDTQKELSKASSQQINSDWIYRQQQAIGKADQSQSVQISKIGKISSNNNFLPKVQRKSQKLKIFRKDKGHLTEPKNIKLPEDPYKVSEENFQFSFLSFKSSQVFLGSFSIKFDTVSLNLGKTFSENTLSKYESCPQGFTVLLTIKKADGSYFYRKIVKDVRLNLVNELKESSISNQEGKIPSFNLSKEFQKYLWKIIKTLFKVQGLAEQNPHLIKESIAEEKHLMTFVPSSMAMSEYESLQQIHDYVIYWFQCEILRFEFNGRKLKTVSHSINDLNKLIQNSEFEKDRRIFTKRKGYVDISSTQSPRNQEARLYLDRNQPEAPPTPLYNKSSEFVAQEPFNRIGKANALILVKVGSKRQFERKFIKILFLEKHVREIQIYEIGIFKHKKTYLLEEKVPEIRQIRNYKGLNTKRLIKKLLFIVLKDEILKVKFKLSPIERAEWLKEIARNADPIYELHSSYQRTFSIRREFEVELSNDTKILDTDKSVFIGNAFSQTEVSQHRRQEVQKYRQGNNKNSERIRNQMLELDILTAKAYDVNPLKSKKFTELFATQSIFKVCSSHYHCWKFQYGWGSRWVCPQNCLEFYKADAFNQEGSVNNGQFSGSQLNQIGTYTLIKLNLHVIAILTNHCKIVSSEDSRALRLVRDHNFVKLNSCKFQYIITSKIFIERVNELTNTTQNGDLFQNCTQNNLPKQTEDDSAEALGSSHEEQEVAVKQKILVSIEGSFRLKCLQQKIFLEVSSTKLIKHQLKFYSLQVFVPVRTGQQGVLESKGANSRVGTDSGSGLRLYQLTDMGSVQNKYMLLTNFHSENAIFEGGSLNTIIQRHLKIDSLTLFGLKFESFRLPTIRVIYRNAHFQERTNIVRKKVISEANYYFQLRLNQLRI